jgi:hypothetical protein
MMTSNSTDIVKINMIAFIDANGARRSVMVSPPLKLQPAIRYLRPSGAENDLGPALEEEASSSDTLDITIDEIEYSKYAAEFHMDAQREPRSSNALEYPEDTMNGPRSSDYWLQIGETVRDSRFSNRRLIDRVLQLLGLAIMLIARRCDTAALAIRKTMLIHVSQLSKSLR